MRLPIYLVPDVVINARNRMPKIFPPAVVDYKIIVPRICGVIYKGGKMETGNLLNSIQIRKILGDISRQSFWNLKTRKDFPDPQYSNSGVELWDKEDIKEYISRKRGDQPPAPLYYTFIS
jgi:predicted DNA-binding transcriptional regulator AlpA